MSDGQLTAITNALLDFGKTISSEVLFPTVIPEAAEIITRDPYAFCIATCLDRGTKVEIIWTISDTIMALPTLSVTRACTA